MLKWSPNKKLTVYEVIESQRLAIQALEAYIEVLKIDYEYSDIESEIFKEALLKFENAKKALNEYAEYLRTRPL